MGKSSRAGRDVGRSLSFDGDALTSVIAPPPCGGEGGVSRSTAPRRRSRPAMQRGPWKGLGRGGHRCTRIRRILAKPYDQSRQSTLLASARAWSPPSPQPLPREGGGAYRYLPTLSFTPSGPALPGNEKIVYIAPQQACRKGQHRLGPRRRPACANHKAIAPLRRRPGTTFACQP